MAALTAALLGISAAETFSKYKSERTAAQIAQQQGNFEGSLFDTNASLAKAQATDAINRGEESAFGLARGERALAGSQRAALAASGVNINTGSAADVVANDRRLSALDEATIRLNATREAWGFETQAASYTAQGQWARISGANRAKALRAQSYSTLLGGAANLAQIWATSPKGVSSTGSKGGGSVGSAGKAGGQ
jgi:hypothetical protein